MKKNLKSINGRISEITTLDEIVNGKKQSKYTKYPTKEEYKSALFSMNHIELAEEMLRLGETAKSEKSFMRTRLLELYDRSLKPRTVTIPKTSRKDLSDLIN